MASKRTQIITNPLADGTVVRSVCEVTTQAPSETPDTVSYHGHRERLRQRFLRSGFDGFADHEVIELLLTLAIPQKDVKQPAKALLAKFGSLRGILDAQSDTISAIKGLGTVAPVALKVIRAAAVRYLQESAEKAEPLATSESVAAFWRMRIGSLQEEVFEVAYLDSVCRLLHDGVERMAQGTIDRAAVYPRSVVASALKRGAAALLLAHNHPNGQVQPSELDKVLTRALVLAAETIQLRIVDHLIVSPDEIFSFRKAGLL